ncbi:MAG: radical SAM family heme chaperone HemW [Verrucomicrobia bacterium]|nr:radical SAM family heme chaperone HemW [Verrucomicrobiota bacterium]
MTILQAKAEQPRLGLYLHIPFCARCCDFCAFYQEAPKRAELDRYLDGMERSLASRPPDRPARTAFWGGGTPGLLPPADLERLGRAMVRANHGVVPEEWTVEMAPATVKAGRLDRLLAMGVNRISIGVQSFSARTLAALGRIHSTAQVEHALRTVREAGFANLNLDLMFAIPGQSIGDWEADLREAVAAGPAHLSCYCLTFEEDTALWLRLQRGETRRHSGEEEAAFYERSTLLLEEAGFRQYEISNFARPGHACRHNLNTWDMQEWLGYGPSASSQYRGWRWTEPPSLAAWLEGLQSGKPACIDEQPLSPTLLAQDALIFGLRRNEGVDCAGLAARFGRLPSEWETFAASLLEEGLAAAEGTRFRLTPRGRLLADRIGAAILEMTD